MKRLFLYVIVLILALCASGCKAAETDQKVCVVPSEQEGWYEFSRENPMQVDLSLGDIPVGTIALIPSVNHELELVVIQSDGFQEDPIKYGNIPERNILPMELSIEAGERMFYAKFEVTRCGDRHFIRSKPSTDGTSA